MLYLDMGYRTIEIAWKPRSHREWATFTACRLEAGRLWGDLVERHYRIRRLQLRWPTKERWQKWAKGRYPGLHSQSVQQIIADFVEATESTRQLRKRGHGLDLGLGYGLGYGLGLGYGHGYGYGYGYGYGLGYGHSEAQYPLHKPRYKGVI